MNKKIRAEKGRSGKGKVNVKGKGKRKSEEGQADDDEDGEMDVDIDIDGGGYDVLGQETEDLGTEEPVKDIADASTAVEDEEIL